MANPAQYPSGHPLHVPNALNALEGRAAANPSAALDPSSEMRSYFASLRPGAVPLDVSSDGLPAPVGAEPQQQSDVPRYASNTGNLPIAQWRKPPDALDNYIAHMLTPAEIAPPQLLAPMTEPVPKPQRPVGFLDALVHTVSHESLPGMMLEHSRLKAEVMALPGGLDAVDGYSPQKDPQIKAAGLGHELWSFNESRSPNETTLIINKFKAREQAGAFASQMTAWGSAGAVLGSFVDPTVIIPIVGGPSKVITNGLWGTLWQGGRAAAINTGIALTQEAAKSAIDQTYRNDGIMETLTYAAGFGFGVGLIHGALSRAPEKFRDPPLGPDGRPMEWGIPGVPPSPLAAMDNIGGYRADGRFGVPDTVMREGGFRSGSSAATPGSAASIYDDLLRQESLVSIGHGRELPETVLGYKVPQALRGEWKLWAFTPGLRLLESASLTLRRTVTDMLDLGGLKQWKNVADATGFAQPTTSPLEATVVYNWGGRRATTLNIMQSAWLEGRGLTPPTTTTAGAAVNKVAEKAMKTQISDWWKKSTELGWADFDKRVSRAMTNLDKDHVLDAHTPFVERAAKSVREYTDALHKEALDHGIYQKIHARTLSAMEGEKAGLERKRSEAAKANDTPLMAVLDKQIEQATAQLEKAREFIGREGTQSSALSYHTRFWSRGQLTERAPEFKDRIARYWQEQGMDEASARQLAMNIHAEVSGLQFQTFHEASAGLLREAGDPMSGKMRSLDLPHHLIEDFLEQSAILMVNHQYKTFAPAIEMTKRFGDPNLDGIMRRAQNEYRVARERLLEAGDTKGIEALKRQYGRDVQDIEAIRDRLLNVAGASKDPHSWSERTIRMLKHYNVWTSMGLSAFSQLGDLVHPAITEGVDAMHRYGLLSMISANRKTIMEMAQHERMVAFDSLEVAHGSMALSMADLGDTRISRSEFERKASAATGAFFFLNGMNHATDLTKNFAMIVSQGNINDALMKWGKHLEGERTGVPSPAPDVHMMERLRSLGIDASDVVPIAKLLEEHGIQQGAVRFANTDAWIRREPHPQAGQPVMSETMVNGVRQSTQATEKVGVWRELGPNEVNPPGQRYRVNVANGTTEVWEETTRPAFHPADREVGASPRLKQVYLDALRRGLQRTVVTPGAIDRPIWVTTSQGSLIAQFRSFGMGSTIRTLYAGLQDADRQFWQGAAVLTASGIVLNELRAQMFYGKTTTDQPYMGILADGVDRSGVMGSVMDINKLLLATTNNGLGLGGGKGPTSPDRVLAAWAGPSAGKVGAAGLVVSDIVNGDLTAGTYNRARSLVPLNNLPPVIYGANILAPDTKAEKAAAKAAAKPATAKPPL